MPELPEVQTVVDYLKDKLAGKTIQSVQSPNGYKGVFDHITKDDGTQVGVSECPDGCGKIKSPMCCGHDMSCNIN